MMLTTLHRYHRNVLNGQDSRNRHWCSCGMLASPIRQPGFQFWLDPQFQLPADGDPERQQLMGQIIGSLPPTGTPGLSSWLGHLGVKQQMGSPTPPHPVCMCLFVYVCVYASQGNKNEWTYYEVRFKNLVQGSISSRLQEQKPCVDSIVF